MEELQNANTYKTQPNQIFFGLDIGTRSVIGTIATIEDELVRIIDVESVEHPKRAMIDGQIEDIAQVSRVAALVKERLEQRLGYQLTRVNVAAAGRALKTHQTSAQIELDFHVHIDKPLINQLEMKAITAANEEMVIANQEFDRSQFYCVGYSVMKYYLDDYPISTLLGHKGGIAKVDMIVTFLPNEVVESLYAAMNSIELQIESLTLEPIAAMNAVIPHELRMLNLALVDIGAGTSDIAISNDGSVVAYAMATVAGDEITESLTHEYLVDFQTAERIKQDLSLNSNTISFTDILGNDYNVQSNEVTEIIEPALQHLCTVICDKIIEVNGKSPSAVFLVGGASKIPNICEHVSEMLGIDIRKVAVGGNKPLKKLIVTDCDVFTPEFVTPLGIAITAATTRSTEDLIVSINGEKISMFKRSGVTVMDLLLSNGYRYSQMIGTSGKNIIYTLNGEKTIARGSIPTAAVIMLGDKPASLFMTVNGGDEVQITPAISGNDAKIIIDDIVNPLDKFNVTLNDEIFTVGTSALINGEHPVTGQPILNNDNVKTTTILTLDDLCNRIELRQDGYNFFINGLQVESSYMLKSGDIIRYELPPIKAETPPAAENEPVDEARTVSESTATLDARSEKTLDEINALLMKQRITKEAPKPPVPPRAPAPPPTPTPPTPTPKTATKATPVDEDTVAGEAAEDTVPSQPILITLNGRRTTLLPKEDGGKYIFLDMLNLVKIDATKPEGNIILRLNGEDAGYLMEISTGDTIDIFWDKT